MQLVIPAMEVHERLKQARIRAGFESGRAAATALGLHPATYSSHENGSRGVPNDSLKRYSRRFNVRFEWLLTGDGEEAATRVESGEVGPDGHPLVTVFDVSASAGPGAIAVSEDMAAYSLAFPPSYLKELTRSSPHNLAIIGVKGESMAPTLHDDDIVMIDTSKTNLDFDGLFVLRFGETLHVKRVTRSPQPGHIKIISDNSSLYPSEDWPAQDVTVVGKVIWKGGKV